MKKLFSILFIFLFFGGVSRTEAYPVDEELEKCLSKTRNTQEMNICADIARISWEKEVEKTFFALKLMLDKKSVKKLEESQKAWEKYRDNEFQSIDRMFEEKQGTMYFNIKKGLKVEIVKQRALNLKKYLDTLNK